MAEQRVATIEDVAREAGVSRQTVSNVVNRPGIVKEATRRKVLVAIEELGYAPNAVARRLRQRRSSTIGVKLDAYSGGISGVVLDRFVHALTEHASSRGLRVLVYAARTLADELGYINGLADGGEVDAIILTGTALGDPRAERLRERGMPFAAFGRPWGAGDADHPWVDIDGAAGTRAATEHLLARAGEHVAFLGWPPDSGTGDDRERGWRAAMGDRAAPRLATLDGVNEGRRLVRELLERGETPVDGIVCASDALAIGAHLAAVRAGRPDLQIVGFDNTAAAEAIGISSVEQLPERVAEGILELLMGSEGTEIRRGPAPQTAGLLVEPRLIVR
ncbi:LacI family DNA-binding transcriptional regulator [Phytomonospora endophytica]|uniref:DNA-binding LacI/PurR family transcriptional regulator n=1 Tax=Phytomonospora endophytica TaxID=714109 RepID=A0A841FRH8_9ACTN|nr:LacI family DNA-binding transcriptional regulator [Phytomonospora endophytica]MBB6036152.1 DNA-binding LacI/PurR family transcriptional regulator [Phytomonospora endophytica]GIG67055.1 alanine racemase [Phytomonospora endophytica]